MKSHVSADFRPDDKLLLESPAHSRRLILQDLPLESSAHPRLFFAHNLQSVHQPSMELTPLSYSQNNSGGFLTNNGCLDVMLTGIAVTFPNGRALKKIKFSDGKSFANHFDRNGSIEKFVRRRGLARDFVGFNQTASNHLLIFSDSMLVSAQDPSDYKINITFDNGETLIYNGS